MNAHRSKVIVVTAALFFVVATHALRTQATDPFAAYITRLYGEVRQRQWNTTTEPFVPFTMGHEAGKFQSNVHFNFVGDPFKQALRKYIAVPDDNIFVTSFVLESIFETLLLAGDIISADDASVTAALNSTLGARDRNIADPTVPIFGFWPQKLFKNATFGDHFEQWPDNLAGCSQQGVEWLEFFGAVMEAIGMGEQWAKFGPQMIKYFQGLDVLFQIPSDADDSSVSIGVARYLAALRTELPRASQLWDAQQFNHSKAFEMYKEFSYCINSPILDKNALDPRNFFWAHDYLSTFTDVDQCIVATWMQHPSKMQQIVTGNAVGPQMPLNVNNVDPTVGANSLYAMSTSLLAGVTRSEGATHGNEWFENDAAARKLYVTTAEFVSYALRTQQWQRRPDLEMIYYPLTNNIVWFVARHVKALESHLRTFGSLPYAEMQTVYELLAAAVRREGLAFLTATAKSGATCAPSGISNSTPLLCWDGFLGNADKDDKNQSTPHYEDRFANTAVAAVGILDAFTYSDESMRKIRWIEPNVGPSNISNATLASAKRVVAESVAYLLAALDDDSTSYSNAFFSGSGKYWPQYQFWYPANVRTNWANATSPTINCSAITTEDLRTLYYTSLFAASGKMDNATFHELAAIGCAGIPSPTFFTTYNGDRWTGDVAWPYWSSPVLSYGVALQVLAKYRALQQLK